MVVIMPKGSVLAFDLLRFSKDCQLFFLFMGWMAGYGKFWLCLDEENCLVFLCMCLDRQVFFC